ncbi:OadG family transporter subunit [Ruminococcus sp.]|uniref:OadG family transporter subunit n=1 Tax=Ruminococcus sp. TaxID=41978 RepID=UPI003F02CAFD
MNLSNVTSILADSGMSLYEKGISAGKVILTGFVVVFAVLLLLILIIKLYSTIVQKAQQSGKKKKEKVKIKEEIPSVSAPAAAPVVSTPSVQSAQDGVTDEVVAVISAAVATMYGSSGKARIKSIKKSDAGRSAWANAGILDNTRPF